MVAGGRPRERTISAAGVDIYVRERGEGHPLLMINGIGANADMWGPTEERLSQVARTVVFDAPGTGRSATPLWPQTIHASAGIVADVLDALGYVRVDVLGFSFGGLVAQQLAWNHPPRVRRLALAATSCGWGSMPGTPRALALIAMPLRYYSRRFSEETNVLLGAADHGVIGRIPELTAARLRYPPSLVGYMGQLCAGATWSSLLWLASVRAPTLVVHGADDQLVPAANGFQLARLLPESRLHVLAEEGHLIVFDPDSSALLLLADFFSSETLRDSSAWSTGGVVDDDETVEAQFERWVGAQPLGVLSGAFRRFLSQSPAIAA